MKKLTVNAVIIYFLVPIIFNQNTCNGLSITSLLPRQQRRHGLLSMNAIDDDTNASLNGNGIVASITGDLCLLIDDENDCFHDVEMNFDGIKAEDFEQQWWNSLNDEQKQGTSLVDSLLVIIPVVIPVVGYFTYEPTAAIFNFSSSLCLVIIGYQSMVDNCKLKYLRLP